LADPRKNIFTTRGGKEEGSVAICSGRGIGDHRKDSEVEASTNFSGGAMRGPRAPTVTE